jgi:methyl-accepting chemotaxis protein
MKRSSILERNEYEANRLAAKVMLATIVFIALVLLLDIMGVFTVPLPTMATALSIAAVLLLVPSILVFLFKAEGRAVKYISVSAAALMVAALNMFLSYHIVILYVYPIAIASLFFSRRLSWYAVLFSVAAVTAGQILGFDSGGVTDKNFTSSYELLIFGVIPRDIQLLALALIFILLSKRTKNMLGNAVDAEEQKRMLERMTAVTDKSFEVSNVLVESVKQLSEVAGHTMQANGQIAGNTERLVNSSENTLKLVDEAAAAVESISASFNRVAEDGRLIADISQQVGRLTEESGHAIEKAIDKMRMIEGAAYDNKAIIAKLGERSNEIGRIVEVITGISAQTNLLALNAAIESARAGEQGKGFAVVASEIRSLAEQSERAAKDIAALIKSIIDDTSKAVDSMDRSSAMAEEGLAVINEAGVSFGKVSSAGFEMNDRIREVSDSTVEAAKSSDRIVGIVRNIRDINHSSIEELQGIAAASEEQLASMQQVTASVDAIEKISEELLEAVREDN